MAKQNQFPMFEISENYVPHKMHENFWDQKQNII
jgi:hypothetical protein